MVHGLKSLEPDPEPDSPTIYMAVTPPETAVNDFPEDNNKNYNGAQTTITSSVPWPNNIFIIRSVSSGRCITLLHGNIILAPPGGPGNFRWECVKEKGWLGFRDPCSGSFLGHNVKGNLLCSARRQDGWENFCVRLTPDGGYVLLMTHWERLWHVGTYAENGVEKLAKFGDGLEEGNFWEFIKG